MFLFFSFLFNLSCFFFKARGKPQNIFCFSLWLNLSRICLSFIIAASSERCRAGRDLHLFPPAGVLPSSTRTGLLGRPPFFRASTCRSSTIRYMVICFSASARESAVVQLGTCDLYFGGEKIVRVSPVGRNAELDHGDDCPNNVGPSSVFPAMLSHVL